MFEYKFKKESMSQLEDIVLITYISIFTYLITSFNITSVLLN